jgi:WD40 repeat protein
MRLLSGHRGPVRTVAYNPTDPCTLASAGDDGIVRLWDLRTDQPPATLPPRGRRDAVCVLAFAPAGERLLVGRRDGSVELWAVAEGTQEEGMRLFEGPWAAAAFAPDGGSILLAPQNQARRAGSPGRLLRWQLGQRMPVERLPWRAGVLSLAFAPGGESVAFGNDRRLVELWRCRPWERLAVFPFAHQVRCLAFSPAGDRILAAAAGKVVEVWDLREPTQRRACKGHRGEVSGVAFTPDGRTLLSSGDRTVRLWDTGSGREVAGWDWGLGRVLALAVSPDGMTAAAGGEKGNLIVWDLTDP